MSHAIAFDTMSSVKRMKEAGFTDAQAETQTRIIAELVDERVATKQDLKDLSTKDDITRLDRRMDTLEFDLRLIKWMLALVIASTVLPALKHLLGG